MNKRSLFVISVAVGLIFSGSAMAQQVTIAEVGEGGREVIVKTTDGKPETYEISGSRTKVTVAGKEGRGVKRGPLLHANGTTGAEATAITCQ